MTTNDFKSGAGAAHDGSGPRDRRTGAAGDAEQVAAHHDAAFHHESAAFHHRQAAQHMANGQVEDAERHIWAAFGHSLNAHEATRAGVSAMRAKDLAPEHAPGEGPPAAGSPPHHFDRN